MFGIWLKSFDNKLIVTAVASKFYVFLLYKIHKNRTPQNLRILPYSGKLWRVFLITGEIMGGENMAELVQNRQFSRS